MCGIIGYKGVGKASEIVIEGLKSLEYRGYDSWGVAVLAAGKIHLHKEVGKIGGIKASDLALPKSSIAIGHTRWATHGGVTKENAHPHLSKSNGVTVIHNGIVENFLELREKLQKSGVQFRSQTDTEIIPQQIEFYMEHSKFSFQEAFQKTMEDIEGSFSVVAIHKDSEQIIAARRGSPLVVGVAKDAYFVASDIPAFLPYTRNVIYLDDDEMVVINENLQFYNLVNHKKLSKETHTIEWDLEQAQLGNYHHFMEKEIAEQAFTLKQAVEGDPKLIEEVVSAIKNAYGVMVVGCGTSYHACVSASYLFSKIAKRHINVVLGSEFPQYADFLTNKTLMIAVSQSGETADILEAVKVAKGKGVKIIAICNVMGSSLTRLADTSIMMNSGPEICVLSTKTYTAQLAIFLQLAYAVIGKKEEGKNLVKKAADAVPQIIEQNQVRIRELAKKFKSSHDFFLIGRDLAYPSALEGALKIKEVSYIHAEGFAGGELKHGTIALIEPGVPTIALVTAETEKLILSNASEIKARGGIIIGIGSQNSKLFDHFLVVPSLSDADPIAMIIPIQLLAYYLALERGCDPDKPRNLAKSVTVK